jgi:hypothetical protein
MALTPIAEQFIACTNATFTVGTSPDTWVGTVTSGGITHTFDVDDMTNNEGLGHYEDVKTTDKYEGDVTIAWKTATPPPMVSGDIFPVAIALPSGPTFTGNWRFNGFNYPMMDPKKGLKISGKITSQGAIVKT